MPHTCPKCHSERVHRSRVRGGSERVFSILGLRFRRCHECNARFVAIGDSILFKSDVDLLLRRIAVVLLAALAVLAIVVVVLWFGRSGENPSSSMPVPAGHLKPSAANALGILALASRMAER